MKYWNLNKINQATRNNISPVPRSLSKTFEKFKQKLNPEAENKTLEGFRISRYQTVASIKHIVLIIVTPIIINLLSKNLVFGPIVDHIWNISQPGIFLNESQEERAYIELQRFEEKLNFEILIGKFPNLSDEWMAIKVQQKAFEIAEEYTKESTQAIKNIFADILSIIVLISLIISRKRELAIMKSFFDELVYGLSDTAKGFLIILFTDIFVGFHSPHGWEVMIEVILRHFGLPESRDFIFLFISTFPVVLDTIFKYWIFRYLNRISPSAVATYHSMNE